METRRLGMRTVRNEETGTIGLVVHDGGMDRVRVDYGDGKGGDLGWDWNTYADRVYLTDVTHERDLAKEWGRTLTQGGDR